jgi:hypothetical protein
MFREQVYKTNPTRLVQKFAGKRFLCAIVVLCSKGDVKYTLFIGNINIPEL